jgi:hypothetical protein
MVIVEHLPIVDHYYYHMVGKLRSLVNLRSNDRRYDGDKPIGCGRYLALNSLIKYLGKGSTVAEQRALYRDDESLDQFIEIS